jgi:hypothetical protein
MARVPEARSFHTETAPRLGSHPQQAFRQNLDLLVPRKSARLLSRGLGLATTALPVFAPKRNMPIATAACYPMPRIDYNRVSTLNQDHATEEARPKASGCEIVPAEKARGKGREGRDELVSVAR